MIFYLIIGFILLAAVLTILRWLAYADTKKAMTALKWTAFVLGGMILGVLVLKGWVGYLAGLLFGLVPAILKWRAIAKTVGNFAKTARGPSRGQTSEVTTRFFRMTLDHDSGDMDGEILEGRHAGRWLSQLDAASLVDLYLDLETEDAQSAELLAAYLDRTHGAEWRERAEAEAEADPGTATGAGAASGPMTRAQALDILGLKEGASADDIRAAHRRLMQTHHPDRGGSSFLAAQINQAKDVLLG